MFIGSLSSLVSSYWKVCSNSSLWVTVSSSNILDFLLFIDAFISVLIGWPWAYDCEFSRQTFSFSFLIQFRAKSPTNVYPSLPLYMYLQMHVCVPVFTRVWDWVYNWQNHLSVFYFNGELLICAVNAQSKPLYLAHNLTQTGNNYMGFR